MVLLGIIIIPSSGVHWEILSFIKQILNLNHVLSIICNFMTQVYSSIKIIAKLLLEKVFLCEIKKITSINIERLLILF